MVTVTDAVPSQIPKQVSSFEDTNVTTVLEGFRLDDEGQGIDLYRLKGWDYPTLCEAYEKGIEKMRKYLQETIRYPREALYDGISGTVHIAVLVLEDGSFKYVRAAMPEKFQLGFGLEEEAIRVVKRMPRWKPGRQAFRKVQVRMTIPITFVLEDDDYDDY